MLAWRSFCKQRQCDFKVTAKVAWFGIENALPRRLKGTKTMQVGCVPNYWRVAPGAPEVNLRARNDAPQGGFPSQTAPKAGFTRRGCVARRFSAGWSPHDRIPDDNAICQNFRTRPCRFASLQVASGKPLWLQGFSPATLLPATCHFYPSRLRVVMSSWFLTLLR